MSMAEAAEGEADPSSDLEIIDDIAESNENAQETATRPRKRRSLVWKYFEKCTHDDYARCTLCGGEYQHSNNTSNLGKVPVVVLGIMLGYVVWHFMANHLCSV